MNSEEHRLFLESIKESQQRSRKVLQRIESTLSGVRTTISEIKDTNDKFDKMKEDYNKILDKLAQKIGNSFSHPLKRSGENDDRPQPSVISMQKAVQSMMKNEEILFVTGAGVSVESGIPTFRGQNGMYEKKFNVEGLELDPEAFINKVFFDKHPLPIWEWIQNLQTLVKKGKPNKTHHLIHQILVQLSKKGKKVVLVTQNIDDLHIKPENGQYQYHPIHGVANKMRCSNLHFQTYDFSKIHQKCSQCGQSLRPHVMFFDESYGIPFGQDIKDKKFNFAVVIGSSLNTGLCIKLMGDSDEKIEINPSPVIEVGNVHPFAEETNKVLEQMLNCIKKYKA